MADTEFEEFRHCFERLPQNTKTAAPFYSLVPDILDEEESPTSSKSDAETDCDIAPHSHPGGCSAVEDGPHTQSITPMHTARGTTIIPWGGAGERRRRKLPEIPKNKKPAAVALYCTQQLSLADELGQLSHHNPTTSLISLKCGYLRNDEESSPDSERLLTDVDSGHSTAHSPTDGPKSMSPMLESTSSFVGSSGGGVPYVEYDLLEATHRGLHKFLPRHADEIEVEIGDPIYVQKESDDLWCEGVNLRTGRLGIFPSAYAVDSDYSDWDPTNEHGHRERYQLGYLGSVETLAHKGTSVVCQAVRKVAGNGVAEPAPTACILEVSDQGLRMVDRSKRNRDQPCIDYFYSLKNVSFCAFHPRDHRYLGFITKHPTLQRFACHVFRGTDSTRPVAESVGRAFQRFYQKFIETAYPIEDIYIE